MKKYNRRKPKNANPKNTRRVTPNLSETITPETSNNLTERDSPTNNSQQHRKEKRTIRMYKRILQTHIQEIRNLSENSINTAGTKRYQKPEIKNFESANYMPTSPVAVRNYRRYEKRYQCNTFGNV